MSKKFTTSWSGSSMARLSQTIQAMTSDASSVAFSENTGTTSCTPPHKSDAYTARAEKVLQHEHGTLKTAPFVGREREMADLMESLDKLLTLTPEGRPPKVLAISGAAGSGKSTLALQLRPRILETTGYFIRGKFEKGSAATPYGGLAMALEDFADQIVDRDWEMDIRRKLKEFLQGNERVLLDVFPSLDKIMEKEEEGGLDHPVNKPQAATSDTAGEGSAQNQDVQKDSTAKPQSPKRPTSQGLESRSEISTNSQRLLKSENDSGAQSKRRIFFFQQFFHAILSETKCQDEDTEGYQMSGSDRAQPPPCIVMLLDDVQWADKSSLDLVSSLVRDPDMGSFLLVTTSRPINDPDHAMRKQFNDWRSERVPMKNFPLDNLCINSVETMVTSCLDYGDQSQLNDDEEDEGKLLPQPATNDQEMQIAPLAQIVHQRTHGNPFFVVEFLKALVEHDLLTYNFGTMQWKWNNDKVHSLGLTMTDSPVDLLTSKAKRLPTNQQLVLLICSCLGGTFKAKLIRRVLKSLRNKEDHDGGKSPALLENVIEDVPVLDTLERFVYLGFLDRSGHSFFFVHDLIRQAAAEFVSKDEIAWTRLRVGKCLLQGIRPQEDATPKERNRKGEANLFLGVDLCNTSAHLIQEGGIDEKDINEKTEQRINRLSRVDLARFNYLAGEKALGESAFVQSVKYLKTGIGLLGTAHEDEELMSSLLEMVVEASYCAGNFDDLNTYSETLLVKRDCPEETRLRMLLCRVKSASGTDYAKAALDMGYGALQLLGMATFPRYPKPYHIVIALLKTKRALKNHNLESLRDLPIVSDKRRETAMEFISAMRACAAVVDQNFLFVIFLKTIRWSLKYGLGKHSPSQFAFYGSIVNLLFGDTKAAVMYGEVALAQAEKMELKEAIAEASILTFGMLRTWTSEMRSCYAPLVYAQKLAAECGDIEMIVYSLFFGTSIVWCTAMISLPELGAKLRRGCAQCRDVQHFATLEMLTTMGGHFRRLCVGKESGAFSWLDDPSASQKRTNGPVEEQKTKASMIDPGIEVFYTVVELETRVLLGELSEALECADRTHAIGTELYMGQAYVARAQMYRGLTYLNPAKSGQGVTRKNLRQATRVLSLLRRWSKIGNQNCAHMVSLIEAELARVKKQTKRAPELYANAINVAESSGHIQDAGTSHECAAVFFLGYSKDLERASYHIEEALRCYRTWGASAVVERIQKKYEQLLESPLVRV